VSLLISEWYELAKILRSGTVIAAICIAKGIDRYDDTNRESW
jgi:hypothetical protein